MSDISFWLAVMAVILLVTSELLSSTGYFEEVAIERKRLRLVALALGIGFLVTVGVRVFRPF